jgi:hypothetical protein
MYVSTLDVKPSKNTFSSIWKKTHPNIQLWGSTSFQDSFYIQDIFWDSIFNFLNNGDVLVIFISILKKKKKLVLALDLNIYGEVRVIVRMGIYFDNKPK